MSELVLKITGAACVMTAAVIFGEYKARSLVMRVKQLQDFQRSLKLFVTEVSFASSVLAYAFKNVSRQCEPPVREFYLSASAMLLDGDERSAQEIWKEAVNRVYPKTCLTAADREIVESLGVSLGVSQQSGQVRQIQLTLQYLEYALETARENRQRNEKMWRYLGVLSGAALVILLL